MKIIKRIYRREREAILYILALYIYLTHQVNIDFFFLSTWNVN